MCSSPPGRVAAPVGCRQTDDVTENFAAGAIAYGVACVVVPMLWGVIVVWATNRVEALVDRRDRARGRVRRGHVPRIEYHI